MRDTLLRQWAMLNLIPREPDNIATRDLLRKLKEMGYVISKRTVERDLMTLSEPFSLTYQTEGNNFLWFWPRNAKTLSVPGMDPQAALAFKLVDEFLRPMLPKSTLAALDPYLRSAEGVLDQSGSASLARWPDKVKIIPRGQPLIPPKLDDAVLHAVYEAVFREVRFRARYRPGRGIQSKEYLFNPLGMVFRDSVIYLVSTLWDYPDIKQFALHRMSQVELLPDRATAVDGFDLDEYIRQHEFEYPINHQPREVELELLLNAKIAHHLRETPLSLDQTMGAETDGTVRLKATVANTAQLQWWLLSFGNKVEVLAPQALREQLSALTSPRSSGEHAPVAD